MFHLESDFKPAGDQPEAVSKLVDGLRNSRESQTLLGVTGSGKTFTLANVIAEFNRPILVLSHNKTLAAQLFSEFKSFFPRNAVEFFISYYDYYLPESYLPQTDTYIAKDASINEDIERYRLSATASLLERRDVIIVASVSCIYGLGSPEDYEFMCVTVERGERLERNDLLKSLVEIQYDRNDIAPSSGEFRARGDTVDVFSPQKEEFTRFEFWGDAVETISRNDSLTGEKLEAKEKAVLFPCRHFVMPVERIQKACASIEREMRERIDYFEKNNLLVEAQRIYQRTTYDIEMMREIGYCGGIENYARHLSGRPPGSRPFCLIDFFPDDFITIIDESHATVPQVGAMYKADRSRKQTLVDHGFRLPSALDNRPLTFDEFTELTHAATLYVSATPGDYELERSGGEVVEQVVRPTGLLDPVIEVRPLTGQVDDLIREVRKYAERGERVLATTLTKKMAERLSDYLKELGVRAKYIHSELDAIQRVKTLRELREGAFDCLIGINLLREGIDLPEVALVVILDADKEGFLRSKRSLVQVAGRAARNLNGKVILYADVTTDSMRHLLETSAARRERQAVYNETHGIVPKTIKKEIRDDIGPIASKRSVQTLDDDAVPTNDAELADLIADLECEMMKAAEALEFERAADIRDSIKRLSGKMEG
ncbi:MAG: excinuclease ABC subunit UvrB [Victivallales bacterium]|nr:excinuclease ABC subunit UvrB [Victivallales bacterium]